MSTNQTRVTLKFPNENHFEYAKMNQTQTGFSIQSTLSEKQIHLTTSEAVQMAKNKDILHGHHHKITSPSNSNRTDQL